MTTPLPPKKKISRRKPGAKPFVKYFDDNTEAAIIRYQQAVIVTEDGKTVPDYAARSKIYVAEIQPAFSTLVENLINVFGYHVIYESRSDLKNECLQFLYAVIPKWKVEKGSKAFSYFNKVSMNWLTVQSKQTAKKVQNYVSLDNRENLSKRDLHIIDDHAIVPSIEDILTSDDVSKNMKKLVETLKVKAKTDNERVCLEAIATIIENIEDIDLLSKRAVMLYIREITGLSSKQLSIVLSALKRQYKIVKEELSK